MISGESDPLGDQMEKILFVCTGNIDRSPTAEDLVRAAGGFEVRSAGTMRGARRELMGEDIEWADRVFVMEDHHRRSVLDIAPDAGSKTYVLGIPDIYPRGDARLVGLLRSRLAEHGVEV